MSGLLEILNQNSGALSVLFSAVVAVATIVYAALTWTLVSETRRMRRAQTEPKIAIILADNEDLFGLIDIVVQNIGLGPAYKIRFRLGSNIETSAFKGLKEMGFIRDGIKYLAPAQKLKSHLTSFIGNTDEMIRTSLDIKVNYEDSTSKNHEDSFSLDLSFLENISQVGEPPLQILIRHIESIKNDIHHLSTGLIALKMISYSKEEFDEERKTKFKDKDQFNEWENI
jgi:hypothetical protein